MENWRWKIALINIDTTEQEKNITYPTVSQTVDQDHQSLKEDCQSSLYFTAAYFRQGCENTTSGHLALTEREEKGQREVCFEAPANDSRHLDSPGERRRELPQHCL